MKHRLVRKAFCSTAWRLSLLAPCLLLLTATARSRDLGQWENTDPKIREWFQALMMPDIPTASCCGEADAYWCDEIHVRNGKTFCNITDDRDNIKLRRTPVPIGTEVEIPDNKLTWKDGNPTGHSIVFLSTAGYVYCFVQNGGV
jgi:hypothetical protein